MKKPKYIWEIVLWEYGEPRIHGRFLTRKEAEAMLPILKKAFLYWDTALRDQIHDKTAGWEIQKQPYGPSVHAGFTLEAYEYYMKEGEATHDQADL